MAPIAEHTSPHRSKLALRLNREGLAGIDRLDYQSYLRTVLWKSIRDWVLKSQDGNCALCDSRALEVHHHDYDEATLWGVNAEGLVALCERCHHRLEFTKVGEKRFSLQEKREVYDSMLLVYKAFQAEAFLLSLTKQKSTLVVRHVGQERFQEFLTCSLLAYEFLVCLPYSQFMIPMPFGHEKLQQKTGAKLSCRRTGKLTASVWATKDSIEMKIAKTCSYPLEVELRKFLESKARVRLVASDA